MPNSFLPPIKQGGSSTREGAILLGDAWNMRHPLTGGGMTVALSDVVILRNILGSLSSFEDWDEVSDALLWWHWSRKPLSSTINLLSGTLYGLFGEHSTSPILNFANVSTYSSFRRCVPCPEERVFQILSTRWEMYIWTRCPSRRVCSFPKTNHPNQTSIFQCSPFTSSVDFPLLLRHLLFDLGRFHPSSSSKVCASM